MRRTLVSLSALFATLATCAVALATGAPPKFGGLKSAVQCIPGAQRPHERRPVNLSWGPASPSNGTTYAIFMAKKSGQENFSQPNWSTRHLTFMTPKLPPGRYFVVRARNHGREDKNRVEKRAQNPCV